MMNSMLSCALLCILYFEGRISPLNWKAMLFTRLITTMMFTILPRFVLRMREIYARDVQSRRGSHMYPTLGSMSIPGLFTYPTVAVFMDAEQDGGSEAAEGMVMVEQESQKAA